MGKSVAVIGGGMGGLVAVKEALVHGLQPTCFEQRADIGGIWYRTDPKQEDVYLAARTYEGMIQNTTKDWYCFSDFPYREGTPLLPSVEDTKVYVDDYADAFGLRQHIQLRTQVEKLEKAPTYAKDGKWALTTKNLDSGAETRQEFDAVFIASGSLTKAFVPELPGIEDFKGQIVHSGQYYSTDDYKDKTVIIYGAGLSGIDIATILAGRAKKIKLITRHGVHVFPRWMSPGKSYEWQFHNRKINEEASMEKTIKAWWDIFDQKYDFNALGLQSPRPLFQNAFAISSHIDTCIYSGQVEVIRGSVDKVLENGVVVGEQTVEGDSIIMATGYSMDLPYMEDPDIFPADQSQLAWWQYMYPIGQTHPTFFGVGTLKVESAFPPVAEMMARAACGILSGSLQLPSEEDMRAWLAKEKAAVIEAAGVFPAYVQTYLHTMDLSKFVGAYPDIDEIAKHSATLASKCYDGPVIPATYRLLGPHSNWDQAKDIIMSLKDPAK